MLDEQTYCIFSPTSSGVNGVTLDRHFCEMRFFMVYRIFYFCLMITAGGDILVLILAENGGLALLSI